MTQSNSFFRKHASDRGVALLFSLGILSALMLLGIAFMGSSLFSRRVAENRSNGNEARLLARSVANLVAGAVMVYDSAFTNDDVRSWDYANVFSRVNDESVSSSCAYDEKLRSYSPTSGISSYSRLDVDRRQSYDGKDSLAEWIYVRDNTGNIIGRYAYQVLPKESGHRLNLHHVLSGNVTTNTSGQTPNNSGRFGQSVNELDLEDILSTNGLASATQVPAYFSDLDAANILADDVSISWIQDNFIEGTSPCFREIAPGQNQRFNLLSWDATSTSDPWLIRFNTTKRVLETSNANDFLDQLTQAVSYNSEVVYDNDLTLNERAGLAFLRVIGNDPGSFSSLTDRRRQIAANFNDYCDDDSIPTSDLANASWSPSNAPTYTGNERTLYINELLIGCFMKFSVSSGVVKLDSANKFPADIVLGAELIDIYGKQNASGNLSTSDESANYSLQGETTGTAKLTILPKIRIANYTYEVSDGGTEPATSIPGSNFDWEPSENDLSGCGNAVAERSIEWKKANDSKISFKRLGTDSRTQGEEDGDPYKFNAAQVAEVGQYTWEFLDSNIQLKDKAKAALKKDIEDKNPGKTVTITSVGALELNGIKRTIKDWKIELAPAGLVLNDGSSNVDYVKVPQISLASVAIDSDYKQPNDATSAIHFLIGGMEAKDPRQNLNINTGASGIATDWTWNPEVTVNDVNNGTLSLPTTASLKGSIVAQTNSDDFINQMKNALTGSCNHDADPHSAGSDTDPETVTDPGWKSNTQMISTAVIRNEPMKSPWELGFIHRGAQFQTINLKKATRTINAFSEIPDRIDSSTGVTYAEGDGGILDWIKMTDCSYSYGKVNMREFLTGFLSAEDPEKDPDAALLAGVFANIPIDASAAEFVRQTPTGSSSYDPISFISPANAWSVYAKPLAQALAGLSQDNKKKLDRRSKLLNHWDWTAGESNDADQERVIGRTFNLLTVNAIPRVYGQSDNVNKDQSSQLDPPPVFYAVIIAQTIKDVGGGDAVSSDHPAADLQTATSGVFDVVEDQNNDKDNIHYDVITGEAKILVTYERNPQTEQVIIRDIENIE